MKKSRILLATRHVEMLLGGEYEASKKIIWLRHRKLLVSPRRWRDDHGWSRRRQSNSAVALLSDDKIIGCRSVESNRRFLSSTKRQKAWVPLLDDEANRRWLSSTTTIIDGCCSLESKGKALKFVGFCLNPQLSNSNRKVYACVRLWSCISCRKFCLVLCFQLQMKGQLKRVS